MENEQEDALRATVRERYAKVAQTGSSCCGSDNTCCSGDSLHRPELSQNLGYSSEDCSSIPEGANMGLGCGNPQAIANLMPGETVLDLGCGGGFDCFLAARQVGPSGKVIGVDMTPEMIIKARNNVRKGNYSNVEIRLGEIEHLPVADNSVDVILSNCVINLSPCKEQVFAEAYRVLRSGGRLAVTDVVAITALPQSLLQNPEAYCGCVSGAAQVAELENALRTVGFINIVIDVKEESRALMQSWFPGSGMENYVASATIQAIKQGCKCYG